MTVEGEEGAGGIAARDSRVEEEIPSSGMVVDELGAIVHVSVDREPEGCGGGVLQRVSKNRRYRPGARKLG